MGVPTPAERLLRRLEEESSRAAAGQDRVLIAFSGGLASLVLAALIRKRTEIACEVLGLPGSSDVEAARVAEKFLDYPVRAVRPAPAAALRMARSLAARDPRLTASEVLAMVPLALLVARHPRDRLVTGFGLTWESARVRSFLAAGTAIHPGLRPPTPAAPRRALVLDVADRIGLPESFSRAARRRPAEGSAVGPAIRAVAHAEHVSVDRLLRPRGPVRENQKRKVTRVIPKSSVVD